MIPLNSDTESQPSSAMREAIARAEVGDEQQGRDPTVNLLQERVAALLGKESALWFPGGTMCNFVAIKVHTQPADAIVADWMAHVIRAESGGMALSSGVLVEHIRTERGVFSADQLCEALDRVATVPVPYGQPVRLVCVEQTHNFGGGSVWQLAELRAIAKVARERGISVHMDGARLMNAVTATGTPAHLFAAEVDSVWMDFTKGLGAPIGAVLAGSRDFIAKARRQKHVFGGAMRQAGIAAAGCLYALNHNISRLTDDHENAYRLAQGLSGITGIRLGTPIPESNMVFFDVRGIGLNNTEFLEAMEAKGIRLGQVRGQIRAVTHLDVSSSDIETTLEAIRSISERH